MRKSKNFELLNGFSKKELRQFEDFIKSPIYNKNQKLILLYKYFDNKKWDIRQNEFDKKKIYSTIYQNEKFNQNKFNLLFSYFIKLLQKYLVFINLEKKDLLQKRILLEEFKDRGINFCYELEYKDIERRKKNIFSNTGDFYENIFFIENFNYQQYRETRNELDNLPKLLNDISFYLKCLNSLFQISLLDRKESFNFVIKNNIEFKDDAHKEVLNFISKNKEVILQKAPYIYMRYLAYMSMKDFNSTKKYFELKNLFLLNINKYTNKFLNVIGASLINLAMRKSANPKFKYKDRINFEKDAYELIAILDKKEAIYINKIASNYLLTDIIIILNQKKYDYAINFLNKHINKIDKNIRENVYKLILSIINFEQEDFNEVLQNLSKLKFYDYYSYYLSKILTIKAYYELGDFNLVITTIDSIKQSFRRKKSNILPDNLTKSLNNFILYVNSLVKVKSNYIDNIKTHKEYLKAKINGTSNWIAEIDWLLEKIEQL